MSVLRTIKALLLVASVYALSLPTALACCCDVSVSAACQTGCACPTADDCCSTSDNADGSVLFASLVQPCTSCCGCDCYFVEPPTKPWTSSDDNTAPLVKDLLLTEVEPPLPVQASLTPGNPLRPNLTHNVRQSWLCVWRN